VLPSVSVAEGGLTFPPTFVGTSSRLPLTLVNAAPVPATLVCDLTKLPDFELLLPREPTSIRHGWQLGGNPIRARPARGMMMMHEGGGV
jgi:hypothetical protein